MRINQNKRYFFYFRNRIFIRGFEFMFEIIGFLKLFIVFFWIFRRNKVYTLKVLYIRNLNTSLPKILIGQSF